ncbi:hypothetical protein MMC17_009728 [Xylographa soralifera]|nr:hypothetical protein [Xylographa soralifera]
MIETRCIVVETRPQRGPQKGQLKALRSRVETLEKELKVQLGFFEGADVTQFGIFEGADVTQLDLESAIPQPGLGTDLVTAQDSMSLVLPIETLPRTPDLTPTTLGLDPITVCATRLNSDSAWPGVMSSSGSTSEQLSPIPCTKSGDLDISDIVWADLCVSSMGAALSYMCFRLTHHEFISDQLYFDRIHAVAPIVHKRHYLSWANQESLTPPQVCLRAAMRTVASAVSAQFRGLSDILYAETRRLLEVLDVDEHCHGLPWSTDKMAMLTGRRIQLEQIQAWLLLAHYELLRVHQDRAQLTIARVLRLVQSSRLYDIDASDVSPVVEAARSMTPASWPDETFAETEEKRRTFWLAFTFDRFFYTYNEWPLTLHEEIIFTRLPAPESNFQNSEPIRMDFLPEAMADGSRSSLSPFAECVVLAALHGRYVSHRRLAQSTTLSVKETHEFWTRHQWLSEAVERRTQSSARSAVEISMTNVDGEDPMVAFTHLLAHNAVIHLGSVIELIPWKTLEYQLAAIAYEQRAHQAATDVVRLARAAPSFSYFKTHPFLPNILSSAASFLMTHVKSPDLAQIGEQGSDGVRHLLDALRRLRGVSNLAGNLSDLLEANRVYASTIISTETIEHDFSLGYLQNG